MFQAGPQERASYEPNQNKMANTSSRSPRRFPQLEAVRARAMAEDYKAGMRVKELAIRRRHFKPIWTGEPCSLPFGRLGLLAAGFDAGLPTNH
jgi:hypothetical protein